MSFLGCRSGFLDGVSTTDVGLPPQFESFRPQQIRAIEATLDSIHRFVCHAMPTGSGKSLMYMAVALITGGRTVFLTSTKGLQDQLLSDFGLCGLVNVKGRNSFDCTMGAGTGNPFGRRLITCEDGAVLNCRDTRISQFSGEDADDVDTAACQCPYTRQYLEACRSRLVVTNYAYWISINQYGKGLGQFDLLVCDEAHDAAEHVTSAMTATITEGDLSLLRTQPPRPWQHVDGWKRWSLDATVTCDQMLKAHTADVNSGLFGNDILRRVRALKTLQTKLSRLDMIGQGQWMVERVQDQSRGYREAAYQIGPVWAREYSEQVLFRGIPKVILVSATLLRKSLEMLGVKAGAGMEYHDYKWQFPVSRGPIIQVPTVKANYKNREVAMDLQLEKIDHIIGSRLDRKGIIHTVSYERARQVVERSEWAAYMVTHTNARMEAQEATQTFRQAAAPSILVTPSMSTGYDFPMQDCEYQIILKAPYPDYSSQLIKVRNETDPQYGHYVMAQELAQACGRGMRGHDDQCETFILDDAVARIVSWKPGLFPSWFRQLYRVRENIPAPPPPLSSTF